MCKLIYILVLTISVTALAKYTNRGENYVSDDSLERLGFVKLNADRERRHTIKQEFTWPNGVIPYKISYQYTEDEIKKLNSSILQFTLQTCVRFIPRQDEEDYLYIYKDEDAPSNLCASSKVGRHGGMQTVSLNSGCFGKRHLLHELMHAIGFYHEHNRQDREKYVKINLDNVRDSEEKFQFKKRPDADILELPYDYKSIMHYGSFLFADAVKKGHETIVPLKDGGLFEINYYKDSFSELDIRKINKLYNCDEEKILKNKDEFAKQYFLDNLK